MTVRKKTGLVLLGLLMVPLLACGGKKSEDLDARAKRLGSQLRCPVCRGVPIADSPSGLAAEMMNEVKEQIRQGKTDEEIFQAYVARYGEWVLLKPEAKGSNLLIWILPVLVVGGGAVGIIYEIRKRNKVSA